MWSGMWNEVRDRDVKWMGVFVRRIGVFIMRIGVGFVRG